MSYYQNVTHSVKNAGVLLGKVSQATVHFYKNESVYNSEYE